MYLFSSIRNKLMVPTLVLTVLLLTLLGMFLAMNSFSGIKLMLTAKANSTVDFISKVSISSYKNFEYFDLDSYVQEIKKDPEVDFATFFDASGVALTKEIGRNSDPYIVVERSISDENGKKLGSLEIGFNSSMIDSNLRNSLIIICISIIAAIILFIFGMKILSEQIVIRRIVKMEALSEKLADGDLTVVVNATGNDEIASLGRAMNKMAENLKDLLGKTRSRNMELEEWQRNEIRFKSGQNDLNNILRGDQNNVELADKALAFLIDYLGGGVGVFYQYNENDETLESIATYAISTSERRSELIYPGEGLAGQAALERKMICINSVPHNYMSIVSAMGEADPLNLVVMPIIHNELLTGVLEIGTFRLFSDSDFAFLNQATEGIAIALNVNRSRQQVKELLQQAQQQTEELRVQQEELQQSNEELAERARLMSEQQNFNIY